MKAAVVRNLREPLRMEEMPTPVPGPDEVLLRVEACGVCHSDVHLSDGDWPQLSRILKLPLIPGHEVIGRVEDLGSEVRDLSRGERLGVPWIFWSCGTCEMCLEGRENLCLAQMITGATVDGGYAEFLCAKASHAVKIPDDLASAEAAPLFCAGVTVFRAIKNSGVRPGERLAVFGVGGLGHLAVQIAVLRGAEVFAVDVAETKLDLARSLGAAATFDAAREKVPSKMRALGGMHCAVVTASSKAAYDAAFASLRRGGSLIVVGAPADPITLPAISMLSGEYRVASSSVGTREDLKEVLDLAAARKIRCRVETETLAHINGVFDRMRRGDVNGRVVLTF